MSDRTELSLEDRLRDHYRHLSETDPGTRTPRPARRSLALAACLLLAVATGGYLSVRNAQGGQPIQAEVGDTGPGATEPSTNATVPAEETEAVPSLGSDPTTTVPTADSGVDSGVDTGVDSGVDAAVDSAAGADPEPGASNADGSPAAPAPGTVIPPIEATRSGAYGLWEPGPGDTCSKEAHDRYWVYGPDGKVYPTWHPPVDPATGCTFGHEHGRDPAGSDLFDIPFPFGYVTEQALAAGADRHDDHTGHKIEWFNDGGYYEPGSPNTNHDQRCDVAYKLHLDTHSDSAFGDNSHEIFHYARCENGAELIYRALHAFGNAGQFTMFCDQQSGPTVNYGVGGDRNGGVQDGRGRNDGAFGSRDLPALQCFEDQVLVAEGETTDWFPFDERWTVYQTVDSDAFGRFFIQFQSFTDLPARYWDGEKLARTVDLCYVTGPRQVRNDEFCGPLRDANPNDRVAWNDPESPFNGADRQLFMADLQLDNEAGQTDWYTDLHGGVWSADPFPGSLRQHVGTTPVHAAASYRPSPIHSIEFENNLGLHAPN